MKKNRVVSKTVNLKDAAFAYFSVCCSEVAEKPACALGVNEKVGTYLGAVPDPTKRNLTLGTWRCSACKRPCKVKRTTKKDATQDPGSTSGVPQTV